MCLLAVHLSAHPWSACPRAMPTPGFLEYSIYSPLKSSPLLKIQWKSHFLHSRRGGAGVVTTPVLRGAARSSSSWGLTGYLLASIGTVSETMGTLTQASQFIALSLQLMPGHQHWSSPTCLRCRLIALPCFIKHQSRIYPNQ